MKITALAVALLLSAPAAAQTYGTWSSNPAAPQRVNPNTIPGGANLYSQSGRYVGNTNPNQYDPNSINNQFGRYGSQFSPDSVNNQFGRYGSQFSPQSPTNQFGSGLKVCGPAGCY